MKKLPLLVYKWDRSKLYVCWNDDIEVKNYLYVKSGEHEFKMALLDDWLPIAKLKVVTK
jgi:hypothetical protein